MGLFRRKKRKNKDMSMVSFCPGDIAIDCGANVGEITGLMLQKGATVHAFEPNVHAFKILQQKYGNHPQAHCFNQAVLDRTQTMRLFMHADADQDKVKWSTGSSLLADKINVCVADYIDVQVIDLIEYITKLGKQVKVLKLDVEGAEYAILGKLLDSEVIDRIDHIFVETHEKKIPSIQKEARRIRRRIFWRRLGSKIHLDWR